MGCQPRLIDAAAFAQQQDTLAAERDTLKERSAASRVPPYRFRGDGVTGAGHRVWAVLW
jgi:hypothetical protein